MNNNDKIKNRIGISLSIAGILILLYISYFGLTHLGTWYDEIFSMWVVNLPFNEFWNVITADVHPPLYYLIYIAFIKIFNIFNITNLTVIGKIVSLIPIYLLIILSLFKLRKRFGILATGIFIFSLVSMPMFIKYALEVRMYSWALFFVTASFIYIYEIIKESSYKNWIILTLLTICSAYTQYFSLLSSVILYLVFLIYIIRKNKELLKKWLLSVVICIIAYVPWIPIAYSQFTTGQSGYWIPKISFFTIVSYVYSVISPLPQPNLSSTMSFSNVLNILSSPQSQTNLIGIILFLIFLVIILILVLKSFKYKDKNNKYSYNGILAFILLPLIGISISIIFFPIFTIRYMVPLLGTFWLSIAILISSFYTKNKKLFTIFLVVLIIMGGLSIVSSLHEEQMDLNKTIDRNETLHGIIEPDSIIIFDNYETYINLGTYYLKNDDCLIYDPMEKDISDFLKNQSIESKINNGSKIYLISDFNSSYQNSIDSNIHLIKLFSNPDENMGNFTIYEIKL